VCRELDAHLIRSHLDPVSPRTRRLTRAAGNPNAPKAQSLGAHVVAGVLVGAFIDALLVYAALSSAFDDITLERQVPER